MRALVTGAGGQLGVELLRTAPKEIHVTGVTHSDCDITNADAVDAVIARIKPDVVINAAAYNAVDDAEKNSDLAYSVNGKGPANLARAVERVGGRIIHISTDYVFDGGSSVAYSPQSPTNPLNIYGKSKLAGEQEIARTASDHLIIRTSWLFSSHGKNFLQIVLGALRNKRPVWAINDQVSVPTACRGLARAIWMCTTRDNLRGVAHWVDGGTASRYDQAVAIREIALERGLITHAEPIESVPASGAPSIAKRPRNSVLDASALSQELALRQRHWRDWLSDVFDEIALEQSVAPGSGN